jgi:hypothetical protein
MAMAISSAPNPQRNMHSRLPQATRTISVYVERSDITNINNSNTKMTYWKVILLSLIICLFINSLSFGLRALIFGKREIGELMVTLTISIMASIIIGSILINKQWRNLGWSLIIAASLTLLFWSATFYSLARHARHGW